MVSFLGVLYLLNGDIFFSSMSAVTLVVLLYFLVDQLRKKKNQIRKNRFSYVAVVYWSLYVAISIPITFLLAHTLTVEIKAKKDIQGLAYEKMDILNDMVLSYTQQYGAYISAEYEPELKANLILISNNPNNSAAKTVLSNEPYEISSTTLNNISSTNVNSYIRKYINGKDKLFASALDSVIRRNEVFFETYGPVFDNWSRLRLSVAFNELDNLIEENYKTLYRNFEKHNHLSNAEFRFPIYNKEHKLNKPFSLWGRYNPLFMIVLALVFHALILLPYFLEPVSGMYKQHTTTTEKSSTDISGGIEL
ncbi:MAG: hypothetical protein C0592_00495 [Marinilabiliales bacterium]|nr:MAG: hypothetical protein C0592_00495 [Marinilabiliales bacterium]